MHLYSPFSHFTWGMLLACALSVSQTIFQPASYTASYVRSAEINVEQTDQPEVASGANPQSVEKDPGQKMILISKFSATDFVPDGDLDKKVWATANKIRFSQDAFQKTSYPEIETTVASLWTSKYLYLAYWCKYTSINTFDDKDLQPERGELWKHDVIEAFIAPQPTQSNHYYEFEVAPNNQWIDLEINLDGKRSFNSAWDSDFAHATRVDAKHRIWTVEMRIPLQSMGVERIARATEWRINLYRADGAGGDEQRHLLSWGRMPLANKSFHQPASFGILRFATPEDR